MLPLAAPRLPPRPASERVGVQQFDRGIPAVPVRLVLVLSALVPVIHAAPAAAGGEQTLQSR